MEVGGLAVGILALAGLFNNAVDCFEYVQLGRSFGTNFQTSLLKLDNARLRLTRWGQAVGLSGNLEGAQSLQEANVQKEDVDKAHRLLEQIRDLFTEAERISEKYKGSVKPNDSTLAILSPQVDMDDVGQTLHDKMRKLCIKRQKKTPLHDRVAWALYEEKYLNRLIEDIVSLVDGLQEVFPATKEKQLKLCEAEVSEIGDSDAGTKCLSMLMGIARSKDTQDKDLEAAIAAALKTDVRILKIQKKQSNG